MTRYGFHRSGPAPTEHEGEALIEALFRESLRYLSEDVERVMELNEGDADDTALAEVEVFFRENGIELEPAWDDDDADDVIVERGVLTLVMDRAGRTLGRIAAPVWPPVGAVIELGNPNRDAIVRGVRMRLSNPALILVDVEDAGNTIPRR